jgi:hypothetical protein
VDVSTPRRAEVGASTSENPDLTLCGACGSHVVNPVGWDEHDESNWRVLFRCGECAWSHEAILTDAEAKRFERGLEPGLREIAETTDARMRVTNDFSFGARR